MAQKETRIRVVRFLVFIYLFGFTAYLFTSMMPTGKFHTFDIQTYGFSENARFLRTVFDLQDNVTLIAPEMTGWTTRACPLDYERTLKALNPIELKCEEYGKGSEKVWYLMIYGNDTEMFHSVESCYMYFGWNVVESDIEEINVQKGEYGKDLYPINMSVFVKKLRLQKGNEERVALYWLLYKNPMKRAEEGAYLFRIDSPVLKTYDATVEELTGFASRTMLTIFAPAVEDTVLEYYSRVYGGLFYGFILLVYVIAAVLFFKPEILPII